MQTTANNAPPVTAVRAKFKVQSATRHAGGDTTIQLVPVTGGSAENEAFFRYTPSGRIDLGVLKPDTAALFQPGAEMYVDFTKVAP